MPRPNVVWVSYRKPDIISRGYWDQGTLERVYLPPLDPVHCDGFDELPSRARTAIVVLPGQHHAGPEHVDRLNRDMARLHGVVLVVTGDECSLFPWADVDHPNLRLWTMTPRPDRPRPPGRFIGEGWPPDCPDILDAQLMARDLTGTVDPDERTVDVSFAGQVNHARRRACVKAARRLAPRWTVRVDPTGGFGQGLPYPEYLAVVAASRIVLCPAGACTQDSFRAYEALEAGAVPIVDGLRADGDGRGYWEFVYPDDPPPFPVIHDWARLGQVVDRVLGDWPGQQAAAVEWWDRQKPRHRDDLAIDLAAVS